MTVKHKKFRKPTARLRLRIFLFSTRSANCAIRDALLTILARHWSRAATHETLSTQSWKVRPFRLPNRLLLAAPQSACTRKKSEKKNTGKLNQGRYPFRPRGG